MNDFKNEITPADKACINSFLDNPDDVTKEADVIGLFLNNEKFKEIGEGESVISMARRYDSR